MLPVLGLLGACTEKEEIVFDHEQPAFEIKENAILIEAIMPQGTAEDDAIYIVGPFNGEDAAVGNMQWQMEHSTVIPEKWGIYLDPSSFENGKTLADGFWFVSESQGKERTVLDEDAVHTLDAGVGTRTNVYVDRWESYFIIPETIEHDGYVIYIDNQSGWDAIALYCYGDGELFGSWPGMLPTGTETIGSKTYTYFDTGWDNVGKNITLIFNNNNGGTQLENFDVLKNITLNRNYYYSVTPDNVELVEVEPENYYVYAADQTGWDALALYAWGDSEAFGSWPGVQPTGNTITIADVEYQQFTLSKELVGQTLNLIFNNNNGGTQLPDLSVTVEARDYFVLLTGDGAELQFEAAADTPDEPEDPVETGYRIYIDDQTGWADLHAHYWTDGGFTTTWPGKAVTGTEEVGGVTYRYIDTEKELEGLTVGIIFTNNGSDAERVEGSVTLDKDRYFRLTTTGMTEIAQE